MAVIIPIIIL